MDSTQMLLTAVESFRGQFGSSPEVAVFAPGRVNLIGEHTDYNGGFVMPFALPFRTIVVGSKASPSQKESRIFSCTIEGPSAGPIIFTVDENLKPGEPMWANYVKGTVRQYVATLPPDAAFDIVVASNVPLGSGLSSSASLE